MTTNRLVTALARRWRSLPPRTIRLRLTVIYGGLFILCSAALLGITYGLVSSRYTPGYVLHVSKQASGVTPPLVGRAAIPGGGQASGGSLPGPVSVPPSVGGTVQRSVPVGPTAASGAATGRVLSVPVPSGSGAASGPQVTARAILIASAQAQSSAALGTLLIGSGIALTIMAVIALWLGWVIAGRALRPLRAITAAAQDISESNLHRRLALEGPDDELTQLADTFDGLLERLETAFAAQRQFAANVSHELRTPLTLERTLLEVALADPDASAATLRTVCEKVLSSGRQQERLIDALLVMSRSQRGLERRETVDLAAVAAAMLTTVDGGDLTVETTLRPALTDGDPRLIERLTGNLIDNGFRHNHPGGHVEVSSRTARGRAVLAVTNTGAPLSPEDLERLFEPFERLDGARTSDSDGLGLGLSIVKAIAQAHAATIATTLPADGGLSIEVSFPATHAPPAPRNDGTPIDTTDSHPDDSQPPTG